MQKIFLSETILSVPKHDKAVHVSAHFTHCYGVNLSGAGTDVTDLSYF